MSDVSNSYADTNLQAPSSAALTGDFAVTSTSWVDVTGLTLTITAKANEQVLVTVTGQCYTRTGTSTGQVTLNIDGSDIGQAGTPVGDGLSAFYGLINTRRMIGIAYVTNALSAGSRTIKVRAKKQAGGDADWTIFTKAQLSVIRLIRNP